MWSNGGDHGGSGHRPRARPRRGPTSSAGAVRALGPGHRRRTRRRRRGRPRGLGRPRWRQPGRRVHRRDEHHHHVRPSHPRRPAGAGPDRVRRGRRRQGVGGAAGHRRSVGGPRRRADRHGHGFGLPAQRIGGRRHVHARGRRRLRRPWRRCVQHRPLCLGHLRCRRHRHRLVRGAAARAPRRPGDRLRVRTRPVHHRHGHDQRLRPIGWGGRRLRPVGSASRPTDGRARADDGPGRR